MASSLKLFSQSLETEPHSLEQRGSEIFINKSNMILKEVTSSMQHLDYWGKLICFQKSCLKRLLRTSGKTCKVLSHALFQQKKICFG